MEAVWVSQGAGADQGLNLTGTLQAHVLMALPFPPELLLAVSVKKQWTIKISIVNLLISEHETERLLVMNIQKFRLYSEFHTNV